MKRSIMKTHLFSAVVLLIISPVILADVPLSVTRKPDVPCFMEPFNFKTIELSLFSSDVTGMVTDDYGDLMWNPAYLSKIQKRSIYLDLNFGNTFTTGQTVSPYYTSADYLVYPSWYQQTYISGIQTTPLYNLAILLPITEKLTVGIINRSLFDYGPFRETYYWDYRYLETNSYMDYSAIMDDLEPQRLEVDDNQQSVYGFQTDVMLAYRLNKRLDLGLKIGNYIYRREGELYDSKWGFYPHSSFADLNDEQLDINGDQYTLGFGLLYHSNAKTTLGVYGELITGNSTEESVSLDSSYSWSERDTDPDYFSFYDYDLSGKQAYDADATRPSRTITYEKNISDKLTFRSFLKQSGSKTDIGFGTSSEDTSFSDRTYDTYNNSSYYFQRLTSHRANRQHFSGEGQENSSQWKWFASLIYRTDNDWSLFGGIQINKYHIEKEYHEESDYYSKSDNNYQYYSPHTNSYLNTHEKYYEYTSESDQYIVSVPIGIKARVIKDFYLILGGEMHYYLSNGWEKGRQLYPEVISKRWENGTLIVNDLEEDRYEEYSSNPAKDFTRSTNVNLGFAYKHPSGINLYVRSNGNIMETAGWNLGFEYRW
ncbi:MAG: hypothetical protein V1715_03505 [bacterium]